MLKVYVCGPTVYSYVHIGNMKPIITFDLFIRAQKQLGIPVKFVHNITDIDDKVIETAQKEQISETQVAKKYGDHYLKMLNLYNVAKPQHMPKVTENLPSMIEFIEKLVKDKKAYVQDGNVFFDIQKIDNYGILSNNRLKNLQTQANDNLQKRNQFDFALWKKTSVGITFASPWGLGRPGWHTECVVFINNFFQGQTIDIHGGGVDLLFPHHENEQAQFYALHHKNLAKTFVHSGLFNWNGDKMSKSLGNVINAKYFAEKYGHDTLRTIILSHSVSSPINLTPTLIGAAQKKSDKFFKAYRQALLETINHQSDNGQNEEIYQLISEWKFVQAFKLIDRLVKTFNQYHNLESAWKIIDLFSNIGYSFAKYELKNEEFELYLSWKKARENKKYTEADVLRSKLKKLDLI